MARIEKWDEVHGTQAPDERMMAFLDSTTDQYAILQLRRSEDTVYERFSSMRELERMGLEPDIDHYEVVYTAPLLPYKDQNTMLEELYAKFNVSRPDDFTGHSLSVSDIVALRQNGVVSCHYVDSIGFQELPGFLKPENYLKAAEMAMEDDYGMIDGVINNGKKEEPAEKASVLDQLKEKQEAVPPAPPAGKSSAYSMSAPKAVCLFALPVPPLKCGFVPIVSAEAGDYAGEFRLCGGDKGAFRSPP